jgi:ectoine hydroxylase-related dioxygenase (phytanoyl-CoA dioxygenase family)
MRALTPTEKSHFDRDGVVHVPAAVEDRWIRPMINAADRVAAAPAHGVSVEAWAGGLARHLYTSDDDFREFVFDAGLATLAAQATESETIRIYFDQIFIKPAKSESEFVWHQDHPYWPIGGTQVVSTWLALTSATAATSALEFVAGSHLWGATYRPIAADGSRAMMNEMWNGFGDLAHSIPEEIIDFENHPENYDVLGFDVEPGDVLLFDYRIVHRSRGNPSANRRVAISWRWLGDDAIWAWQRGNDPFINQSSTHLQPGDRITDDAVFPIVYSRSVATG